MSRGAPVGPVAGLVAPRAYRPHSLSAARDTSTNLVVVGRAAN